MNEPDSERAYQKRPSVPGGPLGRLRLPAVGSRRSVSFGPVLRKIGAATLALAWILVPPIPSQQPVAAIPGPNYSLRIATFNTQLTSPIFDRAAFEDPNNALQRELIAQAICASPRDYDVVALNEVWDEDFKLALANDLQECGYPNFVQRVTSADPLKQEDSGLMLFSRLPLEPPHTTGELNVDADATGPVEFIGYGPDCNGLIECQANKGVALVRLFDDRSASFYNVSFTHMQAGSDPDDAAARRLQLTKIAGFLDSDVVAAHPEESFFVLGDLNIVGNVASPTPEWSTYFPPGATEIGGFYSDTLTDAWDRMVRGEQAESGHADPGFTNRSRSGRLDYILGPTGSEPLRCVQHMWLDFPSREGTPLSDHLGVGADVNVLAPHCSPAIARRPVEEWISTHPSDPDGWNGRDFAGRLEHPGSMQWFRFAEGGTWSFAITQGAGVDFEVYESRDLTTPIAQYEGETTSITLPDQTIVEAREFLIPQPPFYVRVFHPDRLVAGGDYRLVIFHHDCTSQNTACDLLAGAPLFDPALPRDRPATGWFQLNTERADSGRAQRLQIRVERLTGFDAGPLTLSVLDEAGNVIASTRAGPPHDLAPTLTMRDVGPSKLLLRVERGSPDGLVFPRYRIRWTTNLTVLHSLPSYPVQMVCGEEQGPDLFGDDEIVVTVLVDGVPTTVFADDMVDSGEPVIGSSVGPFRFLRDVTLRVQERDPEVNDVEILRIDGLGSDESERHRQEDSIVFSSEVGDGRYFFQYNLSRKLIWDV